MADIQQLIQQLVEPTTRQQGYDGLVALGASAVDPLIAHFESTTEFGQHQIALVLSDRADAYGLQRALRHNIPAAFVPLARPRAAWEQRLLAVLNAFDYDLVLLSGFMRVLSAAFLDSCRAAVINQHPALLPENGGDTVTTGGRTVRGWVDTPEDLVIDLEGSLLFGLSEGLGERVVFGADLSIYAP